MTTITPRQLHDRLQQGEKLHLLDVRTPAEHAEVHVPDVQLVPLDQLDATKLASGNGCTKDQPLYIFCRTGNRAKQAAEKLEKGGYKQCHVVEGGTMAWAEAGLPVNRGTSKVISLERQVRIAAGAIVLTGALLAHFVHPAFIWLSGFVGAGLAFAGLTDTCAMGMLIAKLPWNQRGVDASCAPKMKTLSSKKIVIVGGVAGGASAAARARRLCESCEIIIFERGPHVSFANCGLPYFVGGEIAEQDSLLLQTPESLKARFNLDVRIKTEVVQIDRATRRIRVRELETGREYEQAYDALILSTGASPLRPPLPGIERANHFVVRNIPDVERIMAWSKDCQRCRAVVVGGGYIGLEMAEQLRHRGFDVTLAQGPLQVMTPFDPEMAAWLHAELRANGVTLHLNDRVVAFEPPSEQEPARASIVVLKSGQRLPADSVILGLGVKPEIGLAKDAGLEIGKLGGIRVNEHLQTSDPYIWAVGDAIEVRDGVTGQWALIALAGPANRQGRIAADNILGRPSRYEHTWGTAIVRLFKLTAGCTGANEKSLRRAAIPFHAIHLHPGSHAGYYPGAEPIALKILFAPNTGKLLGAQAIGQDGVDKRIDVLATALKAGMTVHDLAELELAYAPPYGSAKDPVNLAGMAAQNVLAGDVTLAQWNEVASPDPNTTLLLDVRRPDERARGFIPGSINIPLDELRQRLNELPRDRKIIVHCQSGQRSYNATRILSQNGFKAANLSGGYKTFGPVSTATPG